METGLTPIPDEPDDDYRGYDDEPEWTWVTCDICGRAFSLPEDDPGQGDEDGYTCSFCLAP
jgi:hypothetical protein